MRSMPKSIARNVELRQQRWRIKQRELELMAAKNLLLPRLDLVARQRWLGLGDDLINSDGRAYTASNIDIWPTQTHSPRLFDGNFQESQVGLQFSMPLGFRRELATVRNQQLLVARERAVLQDQELELSHQLTEAVRVMDTAYACMQTNFNRVVAAETQVEAVRSRRTRRARSRSIWCSTHSGGWPTHCRPDIVRRPTTIATSPRSISARDRCWNTTACTWPKVRGRPRRISTPIAAPRTRRGVLPRLRLHAARRDQPRPDQQPRGRGYDARRHDARRRSFARRYGDSRRESANARSTDARGSDHGPGRGNANAITGTGDHETDDESSAVLHHRPVHEPSSTIRIAHGTNEQEEPIV